MVEKCCGNCMHFKDEDVNGKGNCINLGLVVTCSDECVEWCHNGEKEAEDND